jgi:sulfur-carrier protein
MSKHVTRSSTIKIFVPTMLRDRCGGVSELMLPVSSVRAVLAEIERRHPALYGCVCDESGAVRRHVNLFVNSSHIRDLEGLETTLAPGDVVTILPAVSGG